ncbi:MAG: carbohydrate kinase family protein [Bacteroidales bacterium]
MKNILIIGGTTFDHIVSLPEFPEPIPHTIHQTGFHEATGSTGAGKALCLTKLGVPNTLYSVLGDDSYGQQIIQHLNREEVDFFFDFDSNGTERHVNIMNANGGRISMFITQSSEEPPINLEKVEAAIQRSDLVVLNIISYCKQIIPVLSKYRKPVWTDLHDYTDGNSYHQPFIDASDYIFLSSDNLSDYKQTMKDLMQEGKELVVCTHGANGATALTKAGEWIDVPALKNFQVVDTNGAGDNFFAGFLYAYRMGCSTETCMRYGALCGAYGITSKQLVYENLTADFLEQEFQRLYHQNVKN